MRALATGLLLLIGSGGALAQPVQRVQPAQPGAGEPVRRRVPVQDMGPPARIEGTCAAIPMSVAAVVPVVEVMLNGRGPYRFAIDTGAQGQGRIAPALARELGLPVVGEARTPAPGGAVATRPIYGAASIAFGGITFGEVRLAEGGQVSGSNMPWDGVLGIDLFRELTLSLDYANGVAAVSTERLAGGVTADFERPTPSLPLEIAGRTFQVGLDTGNAVGALFLPEADARALPLAGEPVERARARTSFGEFAVMEAPLAPSARASVGAFQLPLRTVGWPPARGIGNLGSRALAGTIVRVDRRSSRISIAAPGEPPRCPAAPAA
jgi:hypothetical protein